MKALTHAGTMPCAGAELIEREKLSDNKKFKIDFNSIKVSILFYFVLFAFLLVITIWLLQSVFMDRYYEQMKSEETRNAAITLKDEFEYDRERFLDKMQELSAQNGVYIRADYGTTTVIYDNGTAIESDSIMYRRELITVAEALSSSSLGFVSLKLTDENNTSRYVYAVRLEDVSERGSLCIIAPILPVQSTISILRRQLLYISIISLILATMLAFGISNRLSRPIESITKSAVELSKGKYDVKFSGVGFTETSELAKTLNKASYEMQKTDYYQKDLIANVSHDLKTPLTMIRSYAEMIEDISGDNPEKRNEHLHVIISETDRLNKIVTDMLSVSRLQSNSAELNKENFDIIKATEEVLETFEVLNDQANYNIMPNLCKSTIVYGVENKIKQVMNNLISNAVKYCGEDKFIKVEVKRQGRKVRFDVVDHGVGIPADEIGHVWDRYYRSSANINRDIEGTGLGLSIVKGILTLHNAEYGVESTEGEGSDFWFAMDIVKK